MSECDRKRLEKALSGDSVALRAIVDEMTPVVRARVTRALARRLGLAARSFPDEVSDLTQDVFVMLFSADAKALRAWDSTRGLSFLNFVGLLAQHRAAAILRTQRWLRRVRETPLKESQLQMTQREPEAAPASEILLQRLLEHLEATLTDRGLEMFERLYLRSESLEQICQETGMSAQAVYQWRTRLSKAARDGLQTLEADAEARPSRVDAASRRERRVR